MGGIDVLFIALCASENSDLARHVPYRSATMRITLKEDLTRSIAMKAIKTIMRVAHKNNVKIHIWASTPCTTGCPWRHVNKVFGVKTRDEKLSNTLIQHATNLCRFAKVLGGHYTWEWPERCELCGDPRVRR